MSRYIDADELKRNHMFYHEADNRSYAEERDIDETPTVDAVPVVRKPIRGYEGMYEVDNLARVFSIERVKTVNDNGRVYDKPIQAKQLRQGMHSKGCPIISPIREVFDE